MNDTQADPRRRLPPFCGTVLAWRVAEIWLAAYADARHVLAAMAGLSRGSMAGVGVRSVIMGGDSPQ